MDNSFFLCLLRPNASLLFVFLFLYSTSNQSALTLKYIQNQTTFMSITNLHYFCYYHHYLLSERMQWPPNLSENQFPIDVSICLLSIQQPGSLLKQRLQCVVVLHPILKWLLFHSEEKLESLPHPFFYLYSIHLSQKCFLQVCMCVHWGIDTACSLSSGSSPLRYPKVNSFTLLSLCLNVSFQMKPV